MRIADIKTNGRARKNLGDLDDLCRSIEDVGLLQKVVVTPAGELVAGRRRVAAFEKLGRDDIPAEVAENLTDAARLLRAQNDENTCRKPFAPSEAVAMAEMLKDAFRADAAAAKKAGASKGGKTAGKGRPKKGQPSGKLPEGLSPHAKQTRARQAEAVGMKAKTFEKAAAVVEAAKADPETFAAVVEEMDRTGKVNAAYRQLKKAERDAEVGRLAETVRALPPDDRARVIHGDFRTADVTPGSVDWVITDPPYVREFVASFRDLGAFAARVLKPGGSLLCMTGQSYLPEQLPLLCETLTYHWTVAYLTPGGQAVQCWDRKVNTFWKPVLWLVKGEYAGEWVGDVTRSAVNDNDKSLHHWGQSESGMADLVGRFTKPGDVVCDPCTGAGTTGVVCARLARVFVGIEIDPTFAKAAAARIAQEFTP